MTTFGTFQLKHFIICAAIVSLTGCAKTDSDHVRTKGIHADIGVEAEGNGNTTVYITLQVCSGLEGNDTGAVIRRYIVGLR
jgi:hypothetical protein